jgi:hypothetical protein
LRLKRKESSGLRYARRNTILEIRDPVFERPFPGFQRLVHLELDTVKLPGCDPGLEGRVFKYAFFWLVPSLVSKVQSHLRERLFVETILPITRWKVELASLEAISD